MPFGDRTGPAGMGPMTGRAAGYCAGYSVPGYANPIPGRGLGLGFGRGGWGRRNRYYATGLTGWQQAEMGYPAGGGFAPSAPAYGFYGAPYGPTMTKEQEVDALKGQAEYFEDALEGIRKRIDELEAQKPKD